MCIVCELMARRKRDAEAAEASRSANGQAETPIAGVNYDLGTDEIELDHQRAVIRNTDADTILKLANAAKQLYTANLSTDGVTRLISMLTTKPDERVEAVEPEAPATPAAEEPAAPAVPKELLDIAKAMGWDVQDIQVVRFPKL